MNEPYIHRRLGEELIKKTSLEPGFHTMHDDTILEVLKPTDAYYIYELGYEYPAIKKGIGWIQQGISLTDPRKIEPEPTPEPDPGIAAFAAVPTTAAAPKASWWSRLWKSQVPKARVVRGG